MKQRFLFVALCVFVTLSSCRNNGDEVQALILNETEIEIVKGETFQLEARSYPQQDGATFSWFSEKEEYVKVDDNGLVTAVGRYFKEEDDKEVTPVSVFVKCGGGAAECKVTVLPLEPESISIVGSDAVLKLEPGESRQLELTFDPEDADVRDAEWVTDYAPVVKVDKSTGLITGIAPGTATVKAKCGKAEADIYVNVVSVATTAVSKVTSFNGASSTTVGGRLILNVSLTPSNATDRIVWSSSDTDVAVVEPEVASGSSAVVKGLKAGKVNIIATAGGKQSPVFELTVIDK